MVWTRGDQGQCALPNWACWSNLVPLGLLACDGGSWELFTEWIWLRPVPPCLLIAPGRGVCTMTTVHLRDRTLPTLSTSWTCTDLDKFLRGEEDKKEGKKEFQETSLAKWLSASYWGFLVDIQVSGNSE